MPDTINGLPLHPLVVHAAVVLVPLALVGTVLTVIRPTWRRSLGWWVVLLTGAALGATVAAKESGEHLAEKIGEPVRHASLGDGLPVFVAAMFVTVTVFVAAGAIADWNRAKNADRPGDATGVGGLEDPKPGTPTVVKVLGGIAILVGLLTVAQTFRVGESGAQAVWASALSAGQAGVGTEGSATPSPSAPPSPSASASPSASPSPSATSSASASGSATASGTASSNPSARVITLTTVRKHDVASDCWVAINGKVYDLTNWVSEHPGGSRPIIDLCGSDGTSAFDGQHGQAPKPNAELAGYQIGVLAE